MTTFTETNHAGGFIVSEANGTRSRAAILLLAGVAYAAGAVLGRITSSGKFTNYTPGASDGSQTASAILWDAVDATAADSRGVAVVRDAEINSSDLSWVSGVDASEQSTAIGQLANVGIVDRFSAAPTVTIGATTLTFEEMPAGGVKNTSLGNVTCRIENDDGLLISGDNTTSVTLAIKTGGGALTNGGAKTAVNGVCTWTAIQLSVAGTVVLKATGGGLTEADGSDIVVTDV